jgi:hypothetical protein
MYVLLTTDVRSNFVGAGSSVDDARVEQQRTKIGEAWKGGEARQPKSSEECSRTEHQEGAKGPGGMKHEGGSTNEGK